MKGKKTVLTVSLIVLALAASYYFNVFGFGTIVNSWMFVSDTTAAAPTNAGLRCLAYDASGVCTTFVNSLTNGTFTVVAS